MCPLLGPATSLAPSAEDASAYHAREPAAVRGVHDTPASAEVYTYPLKSTAARAAPSEEDATVIQVRDPDAVR